MKSNWWITFLFWVLFAEKWGLRCIREAPLYLPARFCVDSWLAGLPNSRKNHSQSALYWLFPKPIPPSPSHSTASIIMVHWLLPSQGFVVFCLFSPPDKLPPHLILGDFPWVRFEVLCGFVKTSDGRQHFNFIPFPHQPKFCSAGLSFMIFHSGSPCGALPTPLGPLKIVNIINLGQTQCRVAPSQLSASFIWG